MRKMINGAVRGVPGTSSVDLISMNAAGGRKANGTVASRLMALEGEIGLMRPFIAEDGNCYVTVNEGGKSVNHMVDNALLRYDEWKQYDTAVVEAARKRLVGVARLRSKGLEYRTNGLGDTILQYEDQSIMDSAQVSMDGSARGNADRVEYVLKYLPLPLIHKSFQINARQLASSRKRGMPMDTTSAQQAAIKVAEMAETILFQGYSSYAFGGGIIYGLTDFPSRHTVTLEAKWDAATSSQIITDVQALKQSSINNLHFGPWTLYVCTAYETALDSNYSLYYPGTVRERIEKIGGIEEVVVADFLPANSVVLVENNVQTIREVVGLDVTTLEWEEQGGMIMEYKVMAIMVPQPRADQNGRCGIIHGSKA